MGAAADHDLSGSAPTLERGGGRRWIYPDRRPGPKARLRKRIAVALIAVYVVVPWVSWNGRAILRLDFGAARAHIFGQVFRFSETGYVAFILLALALFLFFVTALRGRVWCGVACPQTVFVEWVVRPIEELWEGPAHQRRRQDQGPKSFGLRARKAGKHLSFLAVAAVIAHVFLAYFAPAATVLGWMLESPAAHPAAFGVMLGVTALFYLDFSWFREQFCAFVCPYARFQAVMMDRHTPAVAYDEPRGEPRGKRAKGACIDCGLCVRVCPTGIDIRNGNQLECINCFRCADACDMIMGSLGRELGLIKALAAAGERPFRPRTVAYGAALAVVLATLGVRLAMRPSVSLTFHRQAGAAFALLADGRTGNSFVMRAANNDTVPHALDVVATAPPGTTVLCGGCTAGLSPMGDQVSALVVVPPVGTPNGTVLMLTLRETGATFALPFLAGAR